MSHTTKTSSQTSLKSHRLQFRCAVRGRIARFDVIEVDDVLDVAEVELGYRPDRTRLSQLMNGRDWDANGRSTALCIRALGSPLVSCWTMWLIVWGELVLI